MSRRRDVPGSGADVAAAEDPRVAELQAAAAAPGRPHELRGAEAPLQALRSAQHGPAPVRRGRVRARLAAATLATKIALGSLVVAAAAGASVAGATGHLPGQHPARQPRVTPTSTSPQPSSTHASRTGSTSHSPRPRPTASPSHSAAPTHALQTTPSVRIGPTSVHVAPTSDLPKTRPAPVRTPPTTVHAPHSTGAGVR